VPAPRRLRALEPVAAGLLLVALATALGAMPDWRAELGRFQALFVSACGAYALAIARRGRWRALPGAGAFVLVVAFALRVAVLPTSPTLSDDAYRYVWEGRVLAAGGDPWRHAPSDAALAPLRDDTIHPRVNHPELRAIYPPLALAGFALVSRVSATLLAVKLWVVLHDLVLVAVLAWWCRRRGGSAWDAAIYAWNPLVVTEYAGSGHHDPTGILWLVLALAWAERRPLGSALAAAAAALVKLGGAIAIPFLWRDWPPRARATVVVVLAAGLGFYAVHALGPGSGLEAFATRWRHNDALHGPLVWLLGGEGRARLAELALLASFAGWALARRLPAVAATRGLLRAGLLLGPVVHPWYLGWVLAFESLGPSAPWLLLSVTVTLGYGSFAAPSEGGAYHPSAAIRAIEYGAPALLAGILALTGRGRGGAGVRGTAGGGPA